MGQKEPNPAPATKHQKARARAGSLLFGPWRSSDPTSGRSALPPASVTNINARQVRLAGVTLPPRSNPD